MPALFSSHQSDSKALRPNKRWLSIGLPFVLLLAFLGQQIIHIDSLGWNNGFSHPLTGWDHLVTMLAVGIWAAQLRGQAIWILPSAFVGVMSLGGLAGAAGLAIPSVEGIILLSCAVFSILITRKVRFSSNVNVLIVAFFAFFHGYAHGQEISASASLISYTLGFMLATLMLHGAGIVVAKLVMFSITCLLTALFSNQALAKAAESTFETHDQSAKVLQYPDNYKNLAFAIEIKPNNSGNIAPTMNPEKRLPENLHQHHDAANQQLTACNTPLIGDYSNERSILAEHSETNLIVNRIEFIAFCNAPFEASAPIGLLAFKHYFPDINHTPGKQMLSNGVGLTSPPLLAHIFTLQKSLLSRQKSVPVIEEFNLQSTFAKATIGNPLNHITPYRRATRKASALLHAAITVCFRPANAYLSPVDNFSQPYGVALQLPSPSTSRNIWLSPRLTQGLAEASPPPLTKTASKES